MKKRFVPQLLLLGAFVLGAPSAFATLTFTAFFDATIGGSAPMVATIDNTLALYSGLFSTNINVSIFFQDGGGLGGSSTTFYSATYGGVGGVCGQLAASATSVDDATSVAATGTCAPGANNPVTNTATIDFSSANGRALGYATPGAQSAGGHSGLDSVITLNTSIMNITRGGATNPAFYDMQSVVEHEVDEVLGTVSGADGEFGGSPAVADLFRYSAANTRTFTVPGTAYLSVNAGVTNLAGYNNVTNCNISAGDCGDFDLASLRVQNYAGTPDTTPDVSQGSPEGRLLDVEGYTFANPVPEPGTLSLFAAGFGLLAGIKKLRRE